MSFQSIGNYQEHKISEATVTFKTDFAQLKISQLMNGGVRVQAIRDYEAFNDFSYAVIDRQLSAKLTLKDKESHFEILLPTGRMQVTKSPMRVSFLSNDGEVVNEDEPAFGIAWDGDEVCNYKSLQKDELFTGMGEKTGPLNKKGFQFVHWNSDQFGYHQETDPLYTSTPFYLAKNGKHWYGIFLDNTSKTSFNFGASNDRFSFFKCERGLLDYYFFHAESPTEILKQYCHLTGFTAQPSKWSLGYQQCRYSYYPDTEILSMAQQFREREIPCDVLYLDIHYMDAYKVFTWHPERFKDFKNFLSRLRELGYRVVIILDPGVKVEKGYAAMEDGIKKDMFLKYPDGELYKGEVWPGWSHFPDFTSANVREWWAEFFEKLVDDGVTGFWNDMNEPAVWGKNVPDLVEFEYDGLKANHKLAHNIYGFQMARASFEGAKKALKGDRAFILTRSGFSGIQRYAAVWTGDNVSNEEHLLMGSRLIMQLGMVGVPFNGNDIGGFIGECSIDLYSRWIALGAFSPFFRGHSMINSRDHEPWSFGEEAEEIARNYINLRYRLLPYIYSAFYEHRLNGLPLSRALLFHYPLDEMIFSGDYQNQFLFGESILVAPVKPHQDLLKVYLPEGQWYDMFNDTLLNSGEHIISCPKDKLPVFVKTGGMILMQSLTQNADEAHNGVLELHVYAGKEGSSIHFYDDDGLTYEYENGAYATREITLSKNSLEIGAQNGDYDSSFKQIKVYWHGFSEELQVNQNGVNLELSKEDYLFVNPISNFDPFEKQGKNDKMVRNLPYNLIDFDKKVPISLMLEDSLRNY